MVGFGSPSTDFAAEVLKVVQAQPPQLEVSCIFHLIANRIPLHVHEIGLEWRSNEKEETFEAGALRLSLTSPGNLEPSLHEPARGLCDIN